MSDAKEGLLEVIRDRLQSKFYSSLFLCWPVINWKMLLVVFGTDSYKNKLKFIEFGLYHNTKYDLQDHLIWLPLFSVLVLNIIGPFSDVGLTYITGAIDFLKEHATLWSKKIKPFPFRNQAQWFDDFQVELKAKDARYDEINAINLKNQTRYNEELGRMKELWRKAVARNFSDKVAGGKDLEEYLLQARWDTGHREGDNELKKLIVKHPLFESIMKVKKELEVFFRANTKDAYDLNLEWFRMAAELPDQESAMELAQIFCMANFVEILLSEKVPTFRVHQSNYYTGLAQWTF